MYRILVVEDDASLAQVLKRQLEQNGSEVWCVEEFNDIMGEFSRCDPHLVLLDIMLPFYNGYYWCGKIREVSGVPVVFISSASDNMNIVMAMNMGGDDFIAKPFDLAVLNAKVAAVLRRTYDLAGKASVLEHRGAILNLDDMTLTLGEGKVELTKNEFRIMKTLLENKGKVVSRNTLMMRLWEDDCYVEENTLTVNITRLRKKLEQLGLSDMIRTKTGSGYILH